MRDRKNLFIAVEGGEGTGKTTFCKLLGTKLEKDGYKVILTREPGGTPFGEQLRQMVLDNDSLTTDIEGFLFAAARSHHVDSLILPTLVEESEKTTIILCDRFLLSGMVYQGFVEEGLGGALHQYDINERTIVDPDFTFLLDCDPEIALNRIQKNNREKNRFDEYSLAFHKRVREGFLTLLDREFGYIVDVTNSDPNEAVEDAYQVFQKNLK